MNALPTLRERLSGGLLGLLVGDAFGVPYEFHPPHDLPPRDQLTFVPPPGFHRAHAGVPPGTWSDDGAQALALLASLLDCGHFDAEDFGRRLVAWYDHGAYAMGGVVFDVGIQTGRAIHALQRGAPAASAGSSDENANGNGSLMRVLPLVDVAPGERRGAGRRRPRAVARHTRPRALAGLLCAVLLVGTAHTRRHVPDAWGAAVSTLRGIYRPASPETAELEFHIRPDDPPDGRGNGYVVDCLRSAQGAVLAGAYAEVVTAAVALGHDTDTTACVAGGIAGLRDGVGAIPQPWRAQLRGMELVAPLLERLLAWRGTI